MKKRIIVVVLTEQELLELITGGMTALKSRLPADTRLLRVLHYEGQFQLRVVLESDAFEEVYVDAPAVEVLLSDTGLFQRGDR